MTVRLTALGEVCSFVGGGTPSRKKPEYFAGDIPWATVKDFKSFTIRDTEEHITEQALNDSASNLVQPGTVLLITRVGLGKVAIAGTRLAINQDIKAVLPNGDDIQPEYLFWFLLSQAKRIQEMGTGATVKGVTLNDVRAIKIPLPPLPEQRRLVDLLSRAEGIVRLRREAQAKAAELIPALFLDMFGDPASNPKGWPVARIDQLCSVQTGATPRREESRYFEGGTIPWIKTTSVVGDAIERAEECITDVAVAETNCKIFPRDTVLVAMYGQGQTRGRVGILSIPATTNQACAAILPSAKVGHRYLFHTLRMQYERLRAMGRGGNQANLNLGMIKELEVPLPPFNLQDQFAAKAEAVRAIATQQTAALATAQATFDALLHQSFAPRPSA